MAASTDMKHGDEESSVIQVAQYTPGSDEEKKLLRQIDMRIVPSIFVL